MKKEFTKEDTLVAKGIAILLLLFYHAFEHQEMIHRLGVICEPVPENLFLLLSSFGNICVAIFVSLTAYGITREYIKVDNLKKSMNKSLQRLGNLIYKFFISYLFIITIFGSKLDLEGLYGSGKQGVLYGIIDATGFAEIFDTPILNPTWWYMELAIELIILVPLAVYCYKKIGYAILMIALLIPNIILLDDSMKQYLFIAILGVVVGYHNIIRWFINYKINVFLQWILGIFGMILCILVRQNYVVYQEFSYIIDGFIAWYIIYFSTSAIGAIPVVKKILAYIGKYSMNIYLVHTFIYMMIYQPQLYTLKYAGLIYIVLLIVCLCIAIAMEHVVIFTMHIIEKLFIRIKKTILQ